MLSEKQYLAEIMEHYSTFLGESEIAVLLRDTSEPKLKEASLFLLERQNHSGKDIENLNHFLNLNNPKKDKKYVTGDSLKNAIINSPTFKRIEVFIKRYEEKGEGNTDGRNIEFLAWLTNFKPRPFEVYRSSKEKETMLGVTSEYKIAQESEKESHISNHHSFNKDILLKFESEMLVDILKDLDLMQNASFVSYRKKIDDDIAMQSSIILKLERKVSKLERKLKKVKLAKQIAGGLGLFLISVDYREPSISHLFDDLLEDLVGIGQEDLLDDFA